MDPEEHRTEDEHVNVVAMMQLICEQHVKSLVQLVECMETLRLKGTITAAHEEFVLRSYFDARASVENGNSCQKVAARNGQSENAMLDALKKVAPTSPEVLAISREWSRIFDESPVR